MSHTKRYETQVIYEEVSKVLEGARDELDDHRIAINEISEEVQSNHGFLLHIDEKLNRLSARVEELACILSAQRNTKNLKPCPLTKREKDVFLALYRVVNLKGQASYKEIADVLNAKQGLVQSFITNLIEKGVPIVKRYDNGVAILAFPSTFNEKQAKENIVGVNSKLTDFM